MIIDTNPEFGLELTLVIPYAYWLHQQGKLEKVITTKGMKPFYYFCNNVEERYDHRTIDNFAAGLDKIPNSWIHHNALSVFGKEYSDMSEDEKFQANGVLDYTKWSPPQYLKQYSSNKFNNYKPYIFISNHYNIEHGHPPIGYFSIEILYEIFNYLTEKGYSIIYKRPKNTEFPLDQNETNSLSQGFTDITAEVEDIGLITDYQLTEYYDNVILLDDIIKQEKTESDINLYNKIQLQLFAAAEGFISISGGSTLLTSYFEKPNISYFTTQTECSRPGYFSSDNYYRKLSNHQFYPILDAENEIIKRGARDYTELLKTIKKVF
tara:strand:+ start:6428 stop:7393 length:966 start_codon:yes stop_codon:yes gene_type:complete